MCIGHVYDNINCTLPLYISKDVRFTHLLSKTVDFTEQQTVTVFDVNMEVPRVIDTRLFVSYSIDVGFCSSRALGLNRLITARTHTGLRTHAHIT